MSPKFGDFLIFQIGTVLLGLPLESVDEVVPGSPITPIPGTANFVSGLAAVRGRIMSVINGASRLGIDTKDLRHFLICRVRGNVTAIQISNPIEAGPIALKPLREGAVREEIAKYRGFNSRMLKGGWQIFEIKEDKWVATPKVFLEVISDQFVSDQMASQIVRG